MNYIQQYMYICTKGKKPDLVKSLFDNCSLNQVVIFVNDDDSALRLHEMMRKASYKSVVIYGRMYNLDEIISQFTRGSIKVLIATNSFARDVDVTAAQMVIMYDVPMMVRSYNEICGDSVGYLDRIGSKSKFDNKLISITIVDNEVDL